MKKRKHRVVVEITFARPVSVKYARNNVYGIVQHGVKWLNSMDYTGIERVTKFTCKQFDRVVQGLLQPHATKRYMAVKAWRAKLKV